MTKSMPSDPQSEAIHNAINPWKDARLRHRLALLGHFPLQLDGRASPVTVFNAPETIAATPFEGTLCAVEKSPNSAD